MITHVATERGSGEHEPALLLPREGGVEPGSGAGAYRLRPGHPTVSGVPDRPGSGLTGPGGGVFVSG